MNEHKLKGLKNREILHIKMSLAKMNKTDPESISEKLKKIFSKKGRRLKILPKYMEKIWDLEDIFYHHEGSIKSKELIDFKLPNIDLNKDK